MQQNYSTTNLFGQIIREQSPCFPMAAVPLKGIVGEFFCQRLPKKYKIDNERRRRNTKCGILFNITISLKHEMNWKKKEKLRQEN
jgi:hypothetical protein